MTKVANNSLTLPKWYDLHAHMRQGKNMPFYMDMHYKMGCEGILAMPNTKPPVIKVSKADTSCDGWSIEEYLHMLQNAEKDAKNEAFSEIIVPLYLSKHTSPEMIEKGVQSGLLRACKFYPPHGTTGAEHGRPIEYYAENGVLKALEDNKVVLCVHGETHALMGADYFDKDRNAEDDFYRNIMPKIQDLYPDLRFVCEHITTKTAVEFVRSSRENVGATVTPQHLLYTIGHLVQGLQYHLYCLPLVKFQEDKDALLEAVTHTDNQQFFAGSDSAPHTTKATECGCAAGCFTGGIAPQLYAKAFQDCGVDILKAPDSFRQFLCDNGRIFYNLPTPQSTFTLTKEESDVHSHTLEDETTLIPLPVGMKESTIPWSISL